MATVTTNNLLGKTIELDGGAAILLSVLITVVMVALIFFLYKGIKSERNRYKEIKLGRSEMKKDEFDELIANRVVSRFKRPFSLFMIELNDAKDKKSSFGMTMFDRALAEILRRIGKIFPENTIICKYSYDVIIVMVNGKCSGKDLSDYAAMTVIECKKPIALGGDVFFIFDMNIGAIIFNEFSKTPEILMQNLEQALVSSKRMGLNQYVVYTPELSNKDSEEYRYYKEIKEAIENNEFTLYYQPCVELSTRKVIAYESLLRWNHKTLGVLSPAKFLTILEQSGDINWVGIWAFEKLILQQLDLKQHYPEKDVILSMNLSPKQLLNPTLIEDMRRILKKYRIEPSSICVEIVEFAYFDKMDIVRKNIEQLHLCGFKIAIDNYGPELNTLTLLERIKIDVIKLDNTFITKAKESFLTKSLATALVEYAKKNKVDLVAQNIETEENAQFVSELGVRFGQGYLFGAPDEIKNFLN